jgi:hypothetical protein
MNNAVKCILYEQFLFNTSFVYSVSQHCQLYLYVSRKQLFTTYRELYSFTYKTPADKRTLAQHCTTAWRNKLLASRPYDKQDSHYVI